MTRRPRGRLVSMLVTCLSAAGLLAPPPAGAAWQRGGVTERVSVASDGARGDDGSWFPFLSDGGRYVLFTSRAGNLAEGDTNGEADAFIRDRVEGLTERITGPDGKQLSSAYGSSITPDGRYVVFGSPDRVLPGDTNNAEDVYLLDRASEAIHRISISSGGIGGNDGSYVGVATPDARFVVFMSWASNLVTGDTNGQLDVFLHDRALRQTELISRSTTGRQSDSRSLTTSQPVSADGRYVVFSSAATAFSPELPVASIQCYLRDRQAGTTEIVSLSNDGVPGDGGCHEPVISANGRYVAFTSAATNLVPSDTNAALSRLCVYVRDLVAGKTYRVSVSSAGEESNGWSSRPSISADGRYVAFDSSATNLWPGQTDVTNQVWVHDMHARTTEVVTIPVPDGDSVNGHPPTYADGDGAALSPDGRMVGFSSTSDALLPDEQGRLSDVFVRDRGGPDAIGGLRATVVGGDVRASGWVGLDARVLSASDDPIDADGGEVADRLGAEIQHARVDLQPQEEAIALRMSLAHLAPVAARPPVSTTAHCNDTGICGARAGGGPAVVYGFGFEVEGRRYEVRAMRAPATAGHSPASPNPYNSDSLKKPINPYIALYRCVVDCDRIAKLRGGIGDAGVSVDTAVPLSDLGITGPTTIRDVRAFTAVG
ncbi:MAG TPA: hypothetical protein VM638_08730, partial [Actinomycetota bacterium]|nr:hypothetical protein [Actinomycetota bacterium]